jgi:hypothetical protein
MRAIRMSLKVEVAVLISLGTIDGYHSQPFHTLLYIYIHMYMYTERERGILHT